MNKDPAHDNMQGFVDTQQDGIPDHVEPTEPTQNYWCKLLSAIRSEIQSMADPILILAFLIYSSGLSWDERQNKSLM